MKSLNIGFLLHIVQRWANTSRRASVAVIYSVHYIWFQGPVALCKLIPWETLLVWNLSSSVVCLPSKQYVLPRRADECLSFLYFIWTCDALDHASGVVLSIKCTRLLMQIPSGCPRLYSGLEGEFRRKAVRFLLERTVRCLIQKSRAPASGERSSGLPALHTVKGTSSHACLAAGPCPHCSSGRQHAEMPSATSKEKMGVCEWHQVCQTVEKGQLSLFPHMFSVAYF